MKNFDSGLLRTLVALADLGSLAAASRRVGRTEAALSLQLRRLEAQAGQPVLARRGRRLVLTEAGEVLLGYARRILALNDEAHAALGGAGVAGTVRFGASQDFGEAWLPPVLAQFRESHRAASLEVRVEGGTRLVQGVEAGELDLGLALGLGDRPGAACIGHLPLVWIAHRQFRWDRSSPLPLAVFTAPCRFRSRGTAELDAAGVPWHVSLTSPSLYGVWAAVNARLGVTVRTPEGLLPDLEIVDRKFGLPPLGEVDVSLYTAPGKRTPAVENLAQLLRNRLGERLLELESRYGRRVRAPRSRPGLRAN